MDYAEICDLVSAAVGGDKAAAKEPADALVREGVSREQAGAIVARSLSAERLSRAGKIQAVVAEGYAMSIAALLDPIREEVDWADVPL